MIQEATETTLPKGAQEQFAAGTEQVITVSPTNAKDGEILEENKETARQDSHYQT